MPTVLRTGPYRVYFYSGDRGEPPHVHVERDEAVAKFWLNPVRIAHAQGFPMTEIRHIGVIISKHDKCLTEAWHEFFSA